MKCADSPAEPGWLAEPSPSSSRPSTIKSSSSPAGSPLFPPSLETEPGIRLIRANVFESAKLAKAFSGCEAVIHCAGIRFERGEQTFARIHRQGTLQVIKAVRQAGVRKVVLLSFLRARPSCGLPFHESKWTAEELVRRCGLDFTILKYG